MKRASSRPVVIVQAFVVLQVTVDFPRLPATLVVKDVGEFVEVALVEFETAVASVGGVGLTESRRKPTSLVVGGIRPRRSTSGRIVATDR
jgi:hypothetical protein